LIRLDLSKNKIKSISVFTIEESFPNLKWLDVSNNKFIELPGIKCPKLEYFDISYNKLEKINEGWVGHSNIKVLKSVDNKFKNLAPFKNMPKLEELYLANNMLTSISGSENNGSLRLLHLRRNKIDKIEDELADLPSLSYLNLRSNKI
jgi:Leucine-rich repeat (LRR) protein